MFSDQRFREQSVHLGILLTLLLAAWQPAAGQAPGQAVGVPPTPAYTPPGATTPAPAPSGVTLSVPAPSAAAVPGQAPSPFQGSVPTGQPTGTTLALSLRDAFARALKYNLGGFESNQNTRTARAARLRNLSALLPNLYGNVSVNQQQVNLQSFGLRLGVIPGFSIPTIVGPFNVQDVRAYLTQQVFNWSDVKNLKSASESERASLYTYKSDRDLVILATGTAYLQVIADAASVDSNRTISSSAPSR